MTVISDESCYLHIGDWLLSGSFQLPCLLLVFPEICLASNQNERNVSAEVMDLGEPLREKKTQTVCIVHNICLWYEQMVDKYLTTLIHIFYNNIHVYYMKIRVYFVHTIAYYCIQLLICSSTLIKLIALKK